MQLQEHGAWLAQFYTTPCEGIYLILGLSYSQILASQLAFTYPRKLYDIQRTERIAASGTEPGEVLVNGHSFLTDQTH